MNERSDSRVYESGHEAWIVETSKDGDRWRVLGRAWKFPGERMLLHAAPRFVRFRHDGDPRWGEPLEQTADLPMTLLDMERGERRELWPGEDCIGLPVLLPGGETGRLLSFGHEPHPDRWSYVLEFRGARE